MSAERPAAWWIERLGLAPHPEGGHFRETYRAAESIPVAGLPARFAGPRALATAIYYLLEAGECSALHRIRSDEIWHHYAGAPLHLAMIAADGNLTTATLGRDSDRGESPQVVVPAGWWFGAALAPLAPVRPAPDGAEAHDPRPFALVGCTVAPGFDFADFELGERADLVRRYPAHRAVIERLTHDG